MLFTQAKSFRFVAYILPFESFQFGQLSALDWQPRNDFFLLRGWFVENRMNNLRDWTHFLGRSNAPSKRRIFVENGIDSIRYFFSFYSFLVSGICIFANSNSYQGHFSNGFLFGESQNLGGILDFLTDPVVWNGDNSISFLSPFSEKNKIGRLYHALPFSKYADKGPRLTNKGFNVGHGFIRFNRCFFSCRKEEGI